MGDNTQARLLVDSSVTTNNTVTATVPAGRRWEPTIIIVTNTTNAVAGTRHIVIEIASGSDIFCNPKASVTQIESLTYIYEFAWTNGQALTVDASTVPTIKQTLSGPVFLQTGDTITVKDENNFSTAAGEDLGVIIHGMESLLLPADGGNVLTGATQIITS